MATAQRQTQDDLPRHLSDNALDAAIGGAAHELAHVVQQDQSVQFNPKELTIDKSVPWQRTGS